MPRPPARRASKVSDERLLAAAADAPHLRELLKRLDLCVDGGNYESVRWRLQGLGALDDRFTRRVRRRPDQPVRDDHTYTDEDLRQAVSMARSRADVLRALGLPPAPEHYPELDRRLQQACIDVSKLPGRAWSRGTRRRSQVPLDVVLARPRIDARRVKERLVEEGLRERCCAQCGRTEWNGLPVPLELDHVDGDRSNNRLENLRMLCPNCHAQTPTWRGRNIGRGNFSVGG